VFVVENDKGRNKRMGRNKKVGLTEQPQNVRLFVEDQKQIKQLAKKRDVPESDVHRELVSEALAARRVKAGSVDSNDTPEVRFTALLKQLETSLAEMKIVSLSALQDEVQTMASRIEYLSAQIGYLGASPK
jgi:hypothetical protein